MTAEPAAIAGARLVLADRVVDGALVLEWGRVAAIRSRAPRGHGPVLDAGGRFVVPALVDLHTDALERHAAPRPGAHFAPEQALVHAERELATAGIGTAFHAVAFLDAEPPAVQRTVALARTVAAMGGVGRLRHRLHVRCEVPEASLVPVVAEVVERERPAVVSLMDHTPGRGQFRTAAAYRRYLERRGVGERHVEAVLRRQAPRAVDGAAAAVPVVEAATRVGALLASHDDDDPERLRRMAARGVRLSEFPVSLAAARAAKELGLPVCMGAPNVVRGASSAGNLSALEALAAGVVDALCSDYHPPSLLPAAFRIAELGLLSLPEAVALVTTVPARIAGASGPTGLAVGAPADLVLVDVRGSVPVPAQVLVAGRVVAADEALVSVAG